MKLLRASLSVGESVFVRQFTFVAFALMAAVSVQAQNFPSKPIRIIVPQVPGGAAEVHAWRAAQKLTEAFGRPVIIENRPGANGAVGARLAARADPDGYTLFNCNINNALNDLLDPDPTTDLSRNFLAITRLTAGYPILTVHPSVQAVSLKEFIGLMKSKPKSISIAHSGKGSLTHLVGEMLRLRAGFEYKDVPYKSGGAQVSDLLGGHVMSTFEYFNVIGQHISSGKVRALAVTKARRLPLLLEIPTMAEAGYPGIEAAGWNGICARAGTPDVVIRSLYREISKSLKDPAYIEQVTGVGAEVGGESSVEFSAYIRANLQQWGRVVKDAGVTLK